MEQFKALDATQLDGGVYVRATFASERAYPPATQQSESEIEFRLHIEDHLGELEVDPDDPRHVPDNVRAAALDRIRNVLSEMLHAF